MDIGLEPILVGRSASRSPVLNPALRAHEPSSSLRTALRFSLARHRSQRLIG